MSYLGHFLGESYFAAESPCILLPQPTGPTGYSLGESYSSAEMQSVYCTAPADWAPRILVGRVLLLY